LKIYVCSAPYSSGDDWSFGCAAEFMSSVVRRRDEVSHYCGLQKPSGRERTI